ncbi:hypothetical protein [Litchfieldia alkalitelluris]|uniref:hypothetical protein n=1 Tax=Litchfieldia alkalitelluris TaxID=304268 RepID=UPI0011161E1A|nr:hypothetical protein [Litchfieldia alkalitelluris]
MKQEKNLLFICQHCGLPQSVTEYIVNDYLINPNVKGYYCSNEDCLQMNLLSVTDKRKLIELVCGTAN